MARAGANEAGRREVHALGALEHPKASRVGVALAVMPVAAQGYRPQVALGLQRRDPPMPNSADHGSAAQSMFRAALNCALRTSWAPAPEETDGEAKNPGPAQGAATLSLLLERNDDLNSRATATSQRIAAALLRADDVLERLGRRGDAEATTGAALPPLQPRPFAGPAGTTWGAARPSMRSWARVVRRLEDVVQCLRWRRLIRHAMLADELHRLFSFKIRLDGGLASSSHEPCLRVPPRTAPGCERCKRWIADEHCPSCRRAICAEQCWEPNAERCWCCLGRPVRLGTC